MIEAAAGSGESCPARAIVLSFGAMDRGRYLGLTSVVNQWVALLVVAVSAALVANCGSGSAADSKDCVAGRQVSCACGGGIEGKQVCKEDGSGYEPCMGCGAGSTAGSGGSGGSGTSTGSTGSGGTSVSSTGSGGASGGSTGSGGGASGGSAGSGGSGGSGTLTFSWVWVDHGGPAFQPTPCSASAGVDSGMLVDPHAFFQSLVQGTDPNAWEQVLNQIEPQLWACGLGQQRGSGGNVRGRLFLPNAQCPDASPPPGDANAIFLGVRQEPPCWDHPVDVVSEN